MNKLSVLFLLDKTRLNKNNKVPLRCRITYLSKRKIFSMGIFINPKNWNSSRQKAIPDNVENNQINTQLSLIKQEINQAFLYLKVQEKSFDVEDIFKQYKGETIKEDQTIMGIFNLHIARQEKLIGISTSKEILDWCNAGSLENPSPTQSSVQPKIIEFRDDFKNIPKPKLPTIAPNEAFDNKGIKDSFEPSSDLENTTEEEVYGAIQKCQNIQELYSLYKAFPQFQSSLKADFEVKKSLIINGN